MEPQNFYHFESGKIGAIMVVSANCSNGLLADYAFSDEEKRDTKVIQFGPGIVEIGSHFFENFPNLARVEFPEFSDQQPRLRVIGEGAFRGCTKLRTLFLPDGLYAVGPDAFRSCTNLREVSFPVSLRKIDNNAFMGCSMLNKVTFRKFPSSMLKIIGDGAFNDCCRLSQFDFPPKLCSIGREAFIWCASLTRISVPESVDEIGSCAFAHCSGLHVVSLPVRFLRRYQPPQNSKRSHLKQQLLKVPVFRAIHATFGSPGRVVTIPNNMLADCNRILQIEPIGELPPLPNSGSDEAV